MKIGELAKRSGVGIDAVRFYEREGLLPNIQRLASGYRVYADADLKRLRFVTRAKALGFTLQEIRDLLALSDHRDGGVVSCSALKRTYRDQLRAHCAGVRFLHLSGSADVISRRLAARTGHFMPAALLRSQLDTLEPLGADEPGVTVDVDRDVDAIVDAFLAGWDSRRRRR